jgi:FKBP-type peptidyl-prolyl cis-trans isomerase FkpA
MSIVKTTVRALSIFALASAAACLSTDNNAPDEIPIEQTNFASTLGVNLSASTRTPNGAYYRDIVTGTGAVVAAGDSISVRYTVWLANGTQIDTNVGSTLPLLTFKLGVGSVIGGFDEGLLGVKVGTQRQLIIPPSLGYGPYDYGQIPGNSVLVFNIEVISSKK